MNARRYRPSGTGTRGTPGTGSVLLRARRRRTAAMRPLAAGLLLAILLAPAGALAHRCDRTDNDRREATRVIRDLTGEIDAMERAIIEALRLQTGQLSGYIAQSAKAVTGALDSQTKLQAQTVRELAETEAMRARRPSRSACETITGLAGLAATRGAAESARVRAAAAETGRISGDRAVVDRAGAAAGDAARFEAVSGTYCNAARAGQEPGLCRAPTRSTARTSGRAPCSTAAPSRARPSCARPSSSRATSRLPWCTTRRRFRPPTPIASAGACCWLERRTRGRPWPPITWRRPGLSGRRARRSAAGLRRSRPKRAAIRTPRSAATSCSSCWRPPLRGPGLVRRPPGDVPREPAARAGRPSRRFR